MGKPVEQRGRHLGVAEHAGPFTEAEVGGDDNAGALVEFAEQMQVHDTSHVEPLLDWIEARIDDAVVFIPPRTNAH